MASFDGLSGGSDPSTASGGASGLGGASGMGGATPQDGDANVGGAVPDAPLVDSPSEVSPRGPFLFYQSPVPLGGIAIDGSEIYWVEAGTSGGVNKMPTGGGGIQVITRTNSQEGPIFDVAVDATNVYWNRDHTVSQQPRSGGMITSPLVSGALTTRFLTVDDQGYVYVTTSAGYIVTSQGNQIRFTDQDGASGIAFYIDVSTRVSERDLAWGYSKGIRQGSIDGGGVQDLNMSMPDLVATAGVAADATDIFWITATGKVRAAPLAKLAPTNPPREICQAPAGFDADAGTDFPADIAVDSTWVYFTDPSAKQILRCLKE